MAKATGTDPGILPLPRGGGAQRAIDETFQTNLSTGTGFYEIPLSLPRGVNDLTPSIGLKYSTGAGNGPFGIGWSLNLPSITRRTERALPRFSDDGVDGADRDLFHLEGQELAPVGGERYRPLLENESSQIRRVVADNSWELRLKNGTLMRFGTTADARTGDGDRVLEWHLTEIRDAHDNAITLTYSRDGSRAYLTTVSYAVYRLDFTYEDRPDAFSSFRAGFEVRTARRCRSIDLILLEPAASPVKSYRLGYTQAPYSLVSLLTQAQLVALEESAGGGAVTELPLPPVTLEYTTFDPDARRIDVFDSDGGPPPSLTGPDLTLLDFEGTGRPGVIEIRNGTARFWRNDGLRWAAPRTLRDLPLNADLGDDALRFIDMEGNGTADLLVGTQQGSGYFPSTPGGGWGAKVSYRQSPNVPLASGSVRLLDVDGDNRIDLLHADGNAFYHYLNRGEAGWSPNPIVVRRRHDLDEWPDVDLASPNVRFADVVGDGRSHLIVIHSGRCVYYPNLGFGQWGAARPMTNAPNLPRHYDPARLFLADIDGDGTADVIYVDFDCVRLWFNQSGAAFSDEVTIHGTPPVANAAILIADMRGNGTNGVLWSYEPALRQNQNYRFLDLTAGVKPLLMRRITSNTRVETTITYGSSTDWPRDTTDPDLAGQTSFLPFPVQVVRRLEMHDPTTDVTSSSEFSYLNGNYDGKERVFLGFGKAERIDAGDATIAANRTVTYFHNQDALHKGLPRRSLAFGDDNSPVADRPFLVELQEYEVSLLDTTGAGIQIQRVARAATTTRNYEREDDFNEVRSEFEYDVFGNVTRERTRSRWTDDQGTDHEDELVTEREFAENPATGLHGFLAREVIKGNGGELLRGTYVFYDGTPFSGLPTGQVELGNRSRERQFVMTVETADAVYGAGTDLTTFGYVREVDPIFGDAYFVDTVRQRFDARGNPVERRDGLGNATTLTFDDFGIYPIQIAFGNGLTLEAEYEYRYGSLTLYRDAMGVEQRFGFDGAGRISASWRFDDPDDKPYLEYQHLDDGPISRQVTLTRTEAGAANQQRRVEYFDGLGQTLQVRASAENGAVVVSGRKMFNTKGSLQREYQSYFSDSFDFSLSDQQPADAFTEYHYDARGRSTRRVDWNGQAYETRYQRGRRSFYTPLDLKNVPGNLSFDTPKTEWLDAHDRVVSVVERKQGESYVTRYAFDALGNRVEVHINDSLVLGNRYDGQGRRIRSAYRDAGVYTYLYDAAGNLVERTDGKGDVVSRAYDDVGRITEVRYGGPAGQVQETYVYDVGDPGEENTAGNLISVSGPFGSVRYRYGKCGCYESKTRSYPGLAGDLTVSYTTDSLRRYTKVTYPDGFEQAITYNEGGLIDSIVGVIDKMSYGPTGKRTRVEFSSGVVTDYEYDPASLRLTRLKTTAPDGVTTYQDMTYQYDEIGAILGILDGASAAGHVQNDRTFSYDALEQLLRSTGTDGNGAFDHNYEYDSWGNITRYPEQFQNDRLLYEDADRPFQITGIENQPASPYSYDAAGNLTQSLHNSYEYDARNRLVHVTRDDGAVFEYLYDHVGSRVKTTVTSGGVSESTFNFDDIYTVTNGLATKVIFDDRGQVATVRDDGSAIVFHTDHLGSLVAESDLATGALLREESYYAFGMAAFGTAFASPYGFTGKKWDAGDGLVFFGGRYYLPEIGRFLTPDPYFLEEQPDKFFAAPRSLQLYTYVLNNPLNMIDPYGEFFGLDDLIVAAVGFVVGAAAYTINWAISGGDFQWSEFFAAGLIGAGTLWLTYSTLGVGAAIIVGAATLAKPAITGGLDQASMGDSFGHRLVGFLSFAIKFASSPVTSTVGLLIGGFGTGFGLWGNVEWFKGGVIAFEYNSSSSAFSAVTLGATVNIWQGNTSNPLFAHELYHSRQYTYFGDAFIPMWVLGGVYGLISSAIAGNFAWSCFSSASPSTATGGGYGNPLEAGAHAAARGGGCP